MKLRGNTCCVFVVRDADCDYVTPLCSQVTYEGLLDDTFGINSGLCLAFLSLHIISDKYWPVNAAGVVKLTGTGKPV